MESSQPFEASQQPVLSPDGVHVALVVDGKLQVRRISNLDLVRSIDLPKIKSTTPSISWSPISQRTGTSDRFLLLDQDTVRVWDLLDADWSATIENPRTSHAEFGLDQTEIMTFAQFGIVTVWDLNTGKGVEVKDVKCIRCHSRSPGQNSVFALLTRSGAVDVVSLYTSGMRLLKSFETKTVDAQGLRWSPDGRWLAVWDSPAMGYKVLVYTADGNLFRSYLGDYFQDELKGLGVKSIEWSPKGDFLVVAGYEKSIALLSTKTFGVAAHLSHPKIARPTKSNIFQEQVQPTRCYMQITQPITPPAALASDSPIPKIGSSILRFSSDGALLATRDDSMPTAVWIWDLGKLECTAVLLQHEVVRKVLWHPTNPTTLLVQCAGADSALYSWSATESMPRVLDTKLKNKIDAQWVPKQAHRKPIIMLGDGQSFEFAYPDGKDRSPVASLLEADSDDSLYEALSPSKKYDGKDADMIEQEDLYTADGFLEDTFRYRGRIGAH